MLSCQKDFTQALESLKCSLLQVNKILKEVRLCQVDGFISALSLLRAKMMIRNGQRPYAQVDPKFYAPLPEIGGGDVGGELRKMTKAKYDALLARIHGKLSRIII